MDQEHKASDPNQTVFRREHNSENPYALISKEFINDKKLSWRARGLQTYLLSKPDNWKVIFQHLLHEAPDGKASFQSAIKELQKSGYLEKRAIREDNGRIVRWENIIREVPAKAPQEPEPDNPDLDNPDLDNLKLTEPDLEDRDLGHPYPVSPDLVPQHVGVVPLLNNDVLNNKTTKKHKRTTHRKRASPGSSSNVLTDAVDAVIIGIEGILETPLPTIYHLVPNWISEHGIEYLINKAKHIRDYAPTNGWRNVAAALRKAIEDDWSATTISGGQTLGQSKGQRDPRYTTFYELFPDE